MNFDDINHELAYNWNNDQAAWDWHSGLFIPDNQWLFVALVVEPAKATLYMGEDGTLSSVTNKISHDIEEFDGVTRIGHDTHSDGRHFKGIIDDVRIYSRALSPAEVASLYAGEGRGPIAKPKWLVEVSREEYAPPELEAEKGEEYYVPIGLEPDQQKTESR